MRDLLTPSLEGFLWKYVASVAINVGVVSVVNELSRRRVQISIGGGVGIWMETFLSHSPRCADGVCDDCHGNLDNSLGGTVIRGGMTFSSLPYCKRKSALRVLCGRPLSYPQEVLPQEEV